MASKSHSDDWSDEEERAPAKEVYEALLGVLEHNTGSYQPPITRRSTIREMLCRQGYKPKWVDNALSMAKSNGEIFQWTHPTGDTYIGVDDPERLREKIASYAQRRTDPRSDLIGVANQRIDYHE